MEAFATVADLATFGVTWAGDDVDRVLTRASEVIADHVTTGYYTDGTGAPTDTDVAAALRDATCAQVEQWVEVGEENDIAGYPTDTFLSGGGISTNRLPPVLAPRARRILRNAGLLGVVAF